jgi:Squalene/phytoene synthase
MKIRDDQADIVAYHAGVGIGLVTALRSTPFRLSFGEVSIPAELFHSKFPYGQLILDYYHKQNETNITLSESDARIFQEAIQHVAYTSAYHFTQARQFQGNVPKSGKPSILLPIIPSLHFLNKLENAKYNLFDPTVSDPNSKRLQLLLTLGRTWLTGIF